jgi:hypothetical protein
LGYVIGRRGFAAPLPPPGFAKNALLTPMEAPLRISTDSLFNGVRDKPIQTFSASTGFGRCHPTQLPGDPNHESSRNSLLWEIAPFDIRNSLVYCIKRLSLFLIRSK